MLAREAMHDIYRQSTKHAYQMTFQILQKYTMTSGQLYNWVLTP